MINIPFLNRLLPDRSTVIEEPLQGVHVQKPAEFVVIGLGRFGTSVAKALTQYGHSVLAIDCDAARVQELSYELPHVVALDATNADALREVGIGIFETGLCCIGSNFEANILVTVLMRQLGVKRVIAKARTRTQRTILLRVGAHEVILPEHESGIRLARRLSGINFVDYLSLGNDIGVVELVVPERYIGQTLAEANSRNVYGLTVIAIRRGEYVIATPGAEARFEPGDEMLVLGTISNAEQLGKQMETTTLP
jgi:trk system potassium uptake protein TrkA